MPRDVFIYILIDPETNEIRYVGKTVNLKVRYSLHLCEKKGTHKNNWLHQLKSKGLKPKFEVIETIYNSDDTDWQHREIYWIDFYRKNGHPLTNLDGGGTGGRSRSPETIEKIRQKNLGRRASEETRKRISLAKQNPSEETRALMRAVQLGKKHSAETRAKQSAALMGRVVSEETRKKIGDANRGRVVTEEERKRLRDMRMKMVFSEESKRKMGAAHIGKRLSPEHLAILREERKNRGPISEETRQKMRDSHRGKSPSAETRSKMAAARLGIPRSAETRAKISAGHMGKPKPRKPKVDTLVEA